MEKKPATSERGETLERNLDHELADILSNAELAGQGGSAFVFRVSGDRIPERFVADLNEIGEVTEIPAGIAMKMLKVYTTGASDHELRMHQKAVSVLGDKAGNPEYASIPRVYFAHRAHFTEAERQELGSHGYRVGSTVDVILMDFVEGRDLKELLAEQVMQRSEGARPQEIQKTTDVDSDFRYVFLKKRGFTVHPVVADQLERTVRLLHAAGLYHRDLHEANVMIDGDPSSPDCRVHIIDFGSADTVSRHEYDKKPVDDLMLIRRIRGHQPEQAGQPGEDELDWLADIGRFRAMAQTHQLYTGFRTAFMQDPAKALDSLRVINERALSQTALQVLGALEDHLLSLDDAQEVVERLKNECRVIPVKRKLQWLLQYLRRSGMQ